MGLVGLTVSVRPRRILEYQSIKTARPEVGPYRIDNQRLSAYISLMALMLSSKRMVGGVCGGLAEWLGWDPTLVRILYTILTIFTAFSGVIVYLILWIIMPRKS